MASKATIINKILELEGAYSDDPNDPGGETNWGITLPFWKEVTGLDDFPVTFERAHAILCYEYLWEKTSTDMVANEMRLCYFAFAVNAGWPKAHKILQDVLGVYSDGIIGPQTIHALASSSLDKTYFPFVEAVIVHYFSVPGFAHYGRGWMNRLAQTLIPLR